MKEYVIFAKSMDKQDLEKILNGYLSVPKFTIQNFQRFAEVLDIGFSSTPEQLESIKDLIGRVNIAKKYTEAKYDRIRDGILIRHEGLNIDNIETITKRLSVDLQTKAACMCVFEFDCCFCCIYDNGITMERYTSGDVDAYAIQDSKSDLLEYAKSHYRMEIQKNESIFDNAIDFFEQMLSDIER